MLPNTCSVSKRLVRSGHYLQQETVRHARLHRRFVCSEPGEQRIDHRLYLFLLGGEPISFEGKTQTLTAQSTVEAELMTISYEAKAFYVPGILQFSRLSWASLHTTPLLMLLQYCCESINNPIKSYSYCFVDTTVEALAVIVRDHFLGICLLYTSPSPRD